MINFDEDIRQQVLEHLPPFPGDRGALASKGTYDLLTIYVNWLRRLVPAQPRRVHSSEALLASQCSLADKHRTGLDQLIAKIETGSCIRPHLSTRIEQGFTPQDPAEGKALQKRRDLDLLLNECGVHHLHLGQKLRKDGFVERKRSDPPAPLLFAAFRPYDAYLIDLMPHDDWTSTHLLEVLVREWPEAGLLVKKLKGIAPGTNYSPHDRKKLRNAGITTSVIIDGEVYTPIGLSLAGYSTQTSNEVKGILNSLTRFKKRLHQDPAYGGFLLSQCGFPIPSQVDFHFVFFDTGGYGVIETHTPGFGMRLDG